MNGVKKTFLSLENAVIVEEIGRKLFNNEEIMPNDYSKLARITEDDEGATITETALLNAVWNARELQKEISRLKGDA
ncbi:MULTISPECIES: hypothetical protein [Bacillus]|uniref:hypothetical protein n=1 Tax=Bacillus TaxID=1386 RepID=UPI0002799B40|nr:MULTISPECIES: hypothetical protein [Bacillus]EJS03425.1 hypothetical protein IKM_02598 [Bacillus mycoides]RAN73992.1 hypothetical protein B5P42_28310 [Bacillus sp. SRB_331]